MTITRDQELMLWLENHDCDISIDGIHATMTVQLDNGEEWYGTGAPLWALVEDAMEAEARE